MTSKRLYKSKTGDLIIEQANQIPSPDDTAYINGNLAPTGKYEVGEEQFILISNGKVYATRGQIEPGLEIEFIENGLNSPNEISNNLHTFANLIRKTRKGYLVGLSLLILSVLYFISLNPSEEEKISTQNLPETIKQKMRDSIDIIMFDSIKNGKKINELPYYYSMYKIDTLNVKYIVKYANQLGIVGQYDASFRYLNRALGYSKNKARLYHCKGDIWQYIATVKSQNGQLSKLEMDSSLYYYELACNNDSNDVELFVTMCIMYNGLQEYEKGIKAIEHAMKLRPENQDLILFRGICRVGLEDYRNAYNDLKIITAFRKTDVSMYYHRAKAASYLDMFYECKLDLDTCINLQPNNPMFYYFRGICETNIKELKYQGYQDIKKAKDMGYDVPEKEYKLVMEKLSQTTI